MTIGERIKMARLKMGYTQEELAKKMGYSGKTSISKIESSGDNVTTNTVMKFADYLNTSAAALFGWEEPEVPEFEPDHIELIELYSKLTKEQKQTVMNLLRSFVIG